MELKIGEAMRLLREEAKMTQGDIARKTGWERSYVSRLERGGVPNPTVMTIVLLLGALNASCDRFLMLATNPRRIPVRNDAGSHSSD